MDRVKVVTGGRQFDGWTSVTITKSMDAMDHGFTLTASPDRERLDFVVPKLVPAAQEEIQISLNDELVLTGYVFSYSPSIDSESFQITISGRSKTADLHDCNIIDQSGQFKNTDGLEVIKRLTSPFTHLNVTSDDSSIGLVNNFQIENSERVVDAIQRIVQVRGYRQQTNASGELYIAKNTWQNTSQQFVEGENIASANGSLDYRNRFSHWQCRGQSKGSDTSYGSSLNSIAELRDSCMQRYRPKVIREYGNIDNDLARKSLNNYAMRSVGESATLDIKYPSWFGDNGQLLDIGQLVWCELPSFLLSRQMVISTIEYSQDESGCYSNITLQLPEAFGAEVNNQPVTQPFGFNANALKTGARVATNNPVTVPNNPNSSTLWADYCLAETNEINNNRPDVILNNLGQSPFGISNE